VVTEDDLHGSSSQWAQGGIAGVVDPEDRFDNHVADTLTAGGGLCHEDVVDAVVREAPTRITELIAWGTRFDAPAIGAGTGPRRRPQPPSHRPRRSATPPAAQVMRAVIEKARALENLEVWPETFAIDLVTHEGAAAAALVGIRPHGKTLVWAKRTILATGGAGQLYRESTNPPGPAVMAWPWPGGPRAEVRDMEFMQFHPTVLDIGGGAQPDHGGRCAARRRASGGSRRRGSCPTSIPRAELAPRDVVSRAITDVHARTHQLERVSRSFASRCRHGAAAIPGHGGDLREVRPGSGPRSDSSAAGGPLHDRRRDRRWNAAARACRVCSPPGRSPRAACMGPIAWRATACSKGS